MGMRKFAESFALYRDLRKKHELVYSFANSYAFVVPSLVVFNVVIWEGQELLSHFVV